MECNVDDYVYDNFIKCLLKYSTFQQDISGITLTDNDTQYL